MAPTKYWKWSFAGIALAATLAVALFAIRHPRDEGCERMKVSRAVGAPLIDVRRALSADPPNYELAIVKIQEAESVLGEKWFDRFKVSELKEYIYYKQRNWTGVLAQQIGFLENPDYLKCLPPDRSAALVQSIAKMHFTLGHYDEAIEYGNRWLLEHPDDTEILSLIAQSDFKRGDCGRARSAALKAISVAEAVHQRPQENWLRLSSYCSENLQDASGRIDATRKLLRYYPNPSDWEYVLALEESKAPLRDDVALHLYRLKYELGALSRPEHFLEYGILAADAGMAAEGAKAVGFATEAGPHMQINELNRKRLARLGAALATRVERERVQIAEWERQSKLSGEGFAFRRELGVAYFGVGRYADAIPVLQRIVESGSATDLDNLTILLGIAHWRQSDRAQALGAFESVSASSPLKGCAELWALHLFGTAVNN
jgi:tetratricopeptide (TPR) repeat protein